MKVKKIVILIRLMYDIRNANKCGWCHILQQKQKKKSSGKHSALVLSQLENSQGGIAGQKTLSSFCVTSTKKTTKKKNKGAGQIHEAFEPRETSLNVKQPFNCVSRIFQLNNRKNNNSNRGEQQSKWLFFFLLILSLLFC